MATGTWENRVRCAGMTRKQVDPAVRRAREAARRAAAAQRVGSRAAPTPLPLRPKDLYGLDQPGLYTGGDGSGPDDEVMAQDVGHGEASETAVEAQTVSEQLARLDVSWVAGCPVTCEKCSAAADEFRAIRTESLAQRRRFDDLDVYPYAAGKRTLHRSVCKEVREAVGRVEGDDSPWVKSALRQFAHTGGMTTGWAALMRLMTDQETDSWIRARIGPRGGTKYRLCRVCRPDLPETSPADPASRADR
ncbi:hypothetical protein [Streptomyces sp. NPDC005989]|uniref:hypothetical protein n=1 Tax=Streptomyces sp. NPDC005989 TaxID=3156727 RepID=UPI0033D466B5